MKCTLCDSSAQYECCASTLCKKHYDKHYKNKSKHANFNQITPRIDETSRSILKNNLTERITLLEKAKKEIISSTESLIKTILSLQISTIKQIKSKINRYSQLLQSDNFNLSYEIEIQQIIHTELYLESNDFEALIEEFKNFYELKLIETKTYSNEVQMKNYKNFLNVYSGEFRCVAVSLDQNILLTGSEDATVRIWSILDRKQKNCFNEHQSSVCCLALSKDSCLAVSGSIDRSVIILDLNRKCLKSVLKGHSSAVFCVVFSVDEELIISGGSSNEIIIWNASSSDCLKKLITTSTVSM